MKDLASKSIAVGVTCFLFVAGCNSTSTVLPPGDDPVPSGANVVMQWDNALLQAIRDTKPGPPMAARSLAIVHTAMFDAWAAYDSRAVGTRYGDALRRPIGEQTPGRKSKAISFAAYRALMDLYPADKPKYDALMAALGYNPADSSTDRATPAGVGNVAAGAVLSFRHVDGSNQLGNLVPGAGPYADYTGYQPMNPPTAVTTSTPLSGIPHPDHWQALTFVNQAGATVTPAFIAPHWGNVIPFAMTSPSQFRPIPPEPLGSVGFAAQAESLVQISANLSDQEKCIAEYWADGPHSELPPGHFCLFAQYVSTRDHHTLDQDAKMFFAVTNAVMDAGIAVWEAKRFYDYCRPVTAIRYLYNGKKIHAWAGPGQDNQEIDGEAWKPYQPDFFPTPPFPEYPSGHSAFSAAAAEVLKSYTGSDAFGFTVVIPAHSLKAEPASPAADVSLPLGTFSDAAVQAGISRRYGGIHFTEGDMASRRIGRECGAQAWAKAQSYFDGTATPMRPVEQRLAQIAGRR